MTAWGGISGDSSARPADCGANRGGRSGTPTVLNVGAGTGSYEPADREVTAVEPSELMISQRPAGRRR